MTNVGRVAFQESLRRANMIGRRGAVAQVVEKFLQGVVVGIVTCAVIGVVTDLRNQREAVIGRREIVCSDVRVDIGEAELARRAVGIIAGAGQRSGEGPEIAQPVRNRWRQAYGISSGADQGSAVRHMIRKNVCRIRRPRRIDQI